MKRWIASLLVATFASLPLAGWAGDCGEDLACWKRRTLAAEVRLDALPLLEQKAALSAQTSDLWKGQSEEAWRTVERLKPLIGERPWYEHGVFWAAVGFISGAGATIGIAFAVAKVK